MTRLAHISTRRPRTVLAVCAGVAAILALVGLGVVHSLSPTITVVPGTESSRAEQLAKAKFGSTVLVPVLVEGPKAQVDAQGPALVRVLRARPHTRALSPWDTGSASASLRPRPTQALIVVAVDRSMKQVVKTDEKQIERTVDRVTGAPVKTYVTGQASLDRGFMDRAIHDSRVLGLVAVGIMAVLLLVGLRAPLTVGVLTGIAAAIVLSSFGLLSIISRFIAIDALALLGGSMMGLALGVGLSLMFLDRFREEEHVRGGGGAPPAAVAATRAVAKAGPAVLLAGCLMILAQLLADSLGPTEILQSLGMGFFACAVLALIAAIVVMPAVTTLIGPRMIHTTFAAPAFAQRGWRRLVGAGGFVTRHAALVGAAVTGLLLLLAVPALGLDRGPLDPSMLPPGSKARVAFDRVERAMGPGYLNSYSIVVASDRGPLTSAKTLTQLQAFERRIARDPQVVSVVGPGAIRTQTKQLDALPTMLASSAKMLKNGPKDLAKLENGLNQAGAGTQQLQAGLGAAAAGAGKLKGGYGQAGAGAGKLHGGLAQAQSGSAQISNGLAQALDGARALQAGAGKALGGSSQITAGLGTASGSVNSGLPALKGIASGAAENGRQSGSLGSTASGATDQASAALAALESMTTGKNDSRYAEAVAALTRAREAEAGVASGIGDLTPKLQGTASGVGAVADQTSTLAAGLTALHTGSGQLQAGIAQLRGGNAQLATGIGKLSTGGGQLDTGLVQLRDGAGALEQGLADLRSGSGQLQSGLSAGIGPTGQLVTGLGVMEAGVSKFAGQLPSPKDLEKLQAQSPGLFYSGYFVLAALQGAPQPARNQAGFALNIARGGNAGQIVVVPRHLAVDSRTEALGKRLKAQAAAFATASGTQIAIGGPASELADFKADPYSQVGWVIAGLSLAIALALMIAMRAILLPVLAVAFNLLTIAATFGLLQLVFGGGHARRLGGPGWLDSVVIIETITAVFGFSLVFLVMLLSRVREEYVASGDFDRSLTAGMRHSAAAATGVGAVMFAAVATFATSELINLRQLMVGVAFAILLDVVLVRPVLLPAALKVLGPAVWWPTGRAPTGGSRLPRPHLHRPHPFRPKSAHNY